MTQPATLRDLEEAAAVWVVFGGSPRAVIARAADALAVGADTPALRELAGEHPGTSRGELTPLLSRALDELDLHEPGTSDRWTHALALRGRSRDFVADPRDPERYVRDIEEIRLESDIDGARPFHEVFYAYETTETLFTPAPTREAVVELAEWVVDLDLAESSARTGARPMSAPVIELPDPRPRSILPLWAKLALVAWALGLSMAISAVLQLLRQ